MSIHDNLPDGVGAGDPRAPWNAPDWDEREPPEEHREALHEVEIGEFDSDPD